MVAREGCRHAKAEKEFFEAMLKTGVPRESGPVRVMLSVHEQGWIFVRAMRDGAEKWQAGHFERIEQEETGEDVHEKYLALAEKL